MGSDSGVISRMGYVGDRTPAGAVPRQEAPSALHEWLLDDRALRSRRLIKLHELKRAQVAHARQQRRLDRLIASVRVELDDSDFDEWRELADVCEASREVSLPPRFLAFLSIGHERSRPTLEELQAGVAYHEDVSAELARLAERLHDLARHLAERDRSPAGVRLAQSIEDEAAAQDRLVERMRRVLAAVVETVRTAEPARPCLPSVRTGAPLCRVARQPVLSNAPPCRHGSAQLAAS